MFTQNAHQREKESTRKTKERLATTVIPTLGDSSRIPTLGDSSRGFALSLRLACGPVRADHNDVRFFAA